MDSEDICSEFRIARFILKSGADFIALVGKPVINFDADGCQKLEFIGAGLDYTKNASLALKDKLFYDLSCFNTKDVDMKQIAAMITIGYAFFNEDGEVDLEKTIIL